VKEEFHSWRRPGSNVDQKKPVPAALKGQAPWEVEPEIIIAQHGMDRRADVPHGLQGGEITKISEVPNLVGPAQLGKNPRREVSVCIGNNGDSHANHEPAQAVRTVQAATRNLKK